MWYGRRLAELLWACDALMNKGGGYAEELYFSSFNTDRVMLSIFVSSAST